MCREGDFQNHSIEVPLFCNRWKRWVRLTGSAAREQHRGGRVRATQMPLELNYRIRIRSSRAKVRRAPDPFDAVLPASDLPSPVACGPPPTAPGLSSPLSARAAVPRPPRSPKTVISELSESSLLGEPGTSVAGATELDSGRPSSSTSLGTCALEGTVA